MPTHAEVLTSLPDFRNHISRRKHLKELYTPAEKAAAGYLRGSYTAFSSLEDNIHATGIGLRQRQGKYHADEIVLKLFVFDKLSRDQADLISTKEFRGIPIDVEPLPVQRIGSASPGTAAAPAVPEPAQDIQPFQSLQRPIVGGISVSPLSASLIGTLGCFLARKQGDSEFLFALSNNHVFTDLEGLPTGTAIAQPGAEAPSLAAASENVFATLNSSIPVRFPTARNPFVTNQFDAALALVTDPNKVQRGKILGIEYDPTAVLSPTQGMKVMKAGRTSGVTHGTVTCTDVSGIQVNYSLSQNSPRIAVFEDVVRIVGDDGKPFSCPGDSGSIVVEENSGHPVALLFAEDTQSTACNLGRLCQHLTAWPV